MRILPINNDNHRQGTNFTARLDLTASRQSLPKGAEERLHRLAENIGIDTDIITIGVLRRTAVKQIKHFGMFGDWTEGRIEKVDTYFGTTCYSPSKNIFEPFKEKIIPGTKYPDAYWKYDRSKEIKMNNYKMVYKYLLELKDKFNPTV